MKAAPFLLVDAGNSRIKWALVDAAGTTLASGSFAHAGDDQDGSLDAEPDWAGLAVRPGSAWVSNVAGAAVEARLDALIEHVWPRLPRTAVSARRTQCGVTNCYPEPARLGSDRWSALIGARAAFARENVLIATFGTATTLEALRADGVFTGGLIAPGWSLMMRSLGEHTAQLPTLATDSARELASEVFVHQWFATDTRHAISAGALLAQTGLVERAWHELSRSWNAPVRLVIGGGAAQEVASALTVPYTRHDSLVLAGLAVIAAQETAPAAQ
ncbi:type III pantothenate kinase [Trinickia caryophylli]|uniref:Type III pantothenate kinase n=1 Tax=Trinickia caryophylli TaxID=28094 RepID=A0A1X7EPC9_TRICW|nr:type III pantothenate kinase [Trinickia caryophylli]PMS10321.1 type III pantothenate kinase [Trinickia caryophylli]TRX20307.1 type III pantothenate kinase [Trinickia caryophylli]WQE13697.1 type III pantothenate kinase [Trinickia caryophylli]SMF37121.1 type III pantothenate kinase [Trinickia caryophylli]GLU32818.1 type III pantothenate kinase [Trinickia caryophylli]